MLYENEARQIAEGLLFLSNEAMTPMMLARHMKIEESDAKKLLEALYEDYQVQKRGFFLKKIGKGYQFATIPEVSPYIEQFFKPKVTSLSKASLEVLAIIAYKKGATRSEVEQIRGVKSDGPLNHLLDKDLIEEAGRLEVVGRPILYQTTDVFLRTFGLSSLEDLPRTEAYSALFSEALRGEGADREE